jgi:[protein-PII] uridylyltransferase
MIRDVCWIVEEHLALSAAAFRENPHSPKTWRGLADKGVSGRRLALLAVFTIVDIRATNPEAWTPWKERLLHELVAQLERPETDSMVSFAQALRKSGIRWNDTILETVDPFLVGTLPAKLLAEDIKSVSVLRSKEASSEETPKVVRLRGGKQTWIRFHSRRDLPGLFLKYVNRLAAVGLSVRHASIHTHPEIGVYDWFEVKTTKAAPQISKMLTAVSKSEAGGASSSNGVRFDAVELVTEDPAEWVVSFRGRDQQGALAEAARALFEEGAEIRWAKVHTWGRQIDDVFGIAPRDRAVGGGAGALIERLQKRLGQTPE